MPSELRILRFKLDEVAESLRSLGPRIGVDIPDGDFICAVSGSGEHTPTTLFTVIGSKDSVTISNGLLAASLIHYCKEIAIPLPRHGDKELHVSSQFIELRIKQANMHSSLKDELAVVLLA